MKTILTPRDKSFLLGQEESNFDAVYGAQAEFKLPSTWKDFYLDIDILDLSQVSDLFVVLKHLEQERRLLSVFYNAELPRSSLQSIGLLLKKLSLDHRVLHWNEKAFVKSRTADGFPHDHKWGSEYQVERLIQLDGRLRESYGLKLFFLVQHVVTYPYGIADACDIKFFLRPQATSYQSSNDLYTIAEASRLQDPAFALRLKVSGLRYEAALSFSNIARQIEGGCYQPSERVFPLGGGPIPIFQALFPQLGILISFSDKEWDSSDILICKETESGECVVTGCVPYFVAMERKFLDNQPFTNNGHVFSASDVEDHGCRLCVLWADKHVPAIDRAKATSLVRAARPGPDP